MQAEAMALVIYVLDGLNAHIAAEWKEWKQRSVKMGHSKRKSSPPATEAAPQAASKPAAAAARKGGKSGKATAKPAAQAPPPPSAALAAAAPAAVAAAAEVSAAASTAAAAAAAAPTPTVPAATAAAPSAATAAAAASAAPAAAAASAAPTAVAATSVPTELVAASTEALAAAAGAAVSPSPAPSLTPAAAAVPSNARGRGSTGGTGKGGSKGMGQGGRAHVAGSESKLPEDAAHVGSSPESTPGEGDSREGRAGAPAGAFGGAEVKRKDEEEKRRRAKQPAKTPDKKRVEIATRAIIKGFETGEVHPNSSGAAFDLSKLTAVDGLRLLATHIVKRDKIGGGRGIEHTFKEGHEKELYLWLKERLPYPTSLASKSGAQPKGEPTETSVAEAWALIYADFNR